MKKLLTLLTAALLALPWAAQAQTGGVHVGATGAPDASAVLDVDATTKGFLPPRLSTSQRDAIASPAAGLTVYNTTTRALNVWNGSSWVAYLVDSTPLLVNFAYTGGPQTYTVPTGITTLTVDLAGAAGGPAYNGGFGTMGQGLGGRVRALLAVTPGQVLTIYVGGAGRPNTAGFNGGGGSSGAAGGGGGATDIRLGGTAISDRILVAGGGGGGGSTFGNPSATGEIGGCGGGLTGCAGSFGNYGGQGGSQVAAGAGGTGAGPSNAGSGATGGSGNGVSGGGGGGYFGGGGGTGTSGGGGGSSFAGVGTSGVVHTQGSQQGNGYVRIYPDTVPAPLLDVSNFVNLPAPDNLGNHTATQNLDLGANKLVGNGGSAGLSIGRNGNVGLGTASPGQLLELAGQAAPTLLLHSNDNSLLAGGTLQFREGSTDYGWNLRHNTGAAEGGNSNDRLILERLYGAGPAAVMAWDQITGNVGVGLTAPTYKFQVAGGDTRVAATGAEQSIFGIDALVGFNDLRFFTDDVNPGERLHINGSALAATAGFVGVNTATPAARLDVAGTVAPTAVGVEGLLRLTRPDNTGTKYASTAEWQLGTYNAATGTAASRLDLKLGNGSTNSPDVTVLTALGNGQVGIGTTAPTQPLEVAGQVFSSTGGFRFPDNSVQTTAAAPDNLGNHTATQNLNLATSLLVGNGGSTGLAIDNAGRVGIGLTAPGKTLDVAGPIGLRNPAASWDHLYLSHDGGTAFIKAGGADNGLALSVGNSGSGSYDAQPYTEGLRLLPSGNVGLGTPTPGQLLELAGRPAPALLLHSNTNNVVTGSTLQFRESDLTYGWNLRHNTGGLEGGSSADRLVLERLNGNGAAPVLTWEQATGNATAAADLTVAGTLDIGLTTVVRDYTIAANSYSAYVVTCPAGTRLLSGGGGHRDNNLAQADIVVNFSGPDSTNVDYTWTVRLTNNATTSRAVQVYCTCARVR